MRSLWMYVNYVRMLPVLIDTLLQIADTVERLAANDGTAKPDLDTLRQQNNRLRALADLARK